MHAPTTAKVWTHPMIMLSLIYFEYTLLEGNIFVVNFFSITIFYSKPMYVMLHHCFHSISLYGMFQLNMFLFFLSECIAYLQERRKMSSRRTIRNAQALEEFHHPLLPATPATSLW